MIHPRMQHRSGFTLIELMVTMAIGSAILFVAATILGRAGEGYDRGSGSVAAEREARAVLTQIGSDLSKAEWHRDTILENAGEDWKKANLGFLALQPDDAQSDDGRNGDLCAIHYYLKDIEVGNTTVRCLMRGFRESGEVFAALRSGTIDSVFKEEKNDEPVSFGVLAFEAESLTRGETGKWEAWNGDVSKAPQALRLRLTVARRELLGKLTTTSEWDSSPLRGKPQDAIHNRDLEIYEVIQRFGNDA